MPEIGSDAWIDAFSAAVAGLEAAGVEITVLHRIDGGPAWRVTAAGGALRVERAEPTEDADLVFTWQPADARAVARGELAPLAPFQAGRLRVGGDLTRLTEVARLFARFPAVPAS